MILLLLSIVFRNAQSELPLVLNLLLGGSLIYFLFNYFNSLKPINTSWTLNKKYTIPFGIIIILLIIILQIISKIDTGQENFFVMDGDIWLMEVIGISLSILVFFFLLSWTTEQWKYFQSLKDSKAKAELSLLKNQINPHFFFNTLNNLYSLIKKDPEKAQSYVLKLSDLMRFTIYDGEKELVSLEEEIEYLNNFIDLQVARYHKQINITFEKNLSNPKTPVAPLIFIILLENAFKHGVEKSIENSYIHIKITESNSSVHFEIKNNIELHKLNEIKGIGLKNLKERLNLLYPKKHKLLFNSNDHYFTATLELITT